MKNRPPNVICQICNKSGHVASKCYKITKCEFCIRTSHSTSTCRSFSIATDVVCQICNKPRHTANACYRIKNQVRSNQRSEITCQICNKNGHSASSYYLVKKSASTKISDKSAVIECRYCKNKGHHINQKRERRNQNVSKNEKNLPGSSAHQEIPAAQPRSLSSLNFDDLLCELLPLN